MANKRYKKKNRVDTYKPPFDETILNEPVNNLSFRADNTLTLLQSDGITTIGDVLKREEKEFYRIFTFKKRNLLDVKGAVKARKLFLKPTIEVKEENTPTPEVAREPLPARLPKNEPRRRGDKNRNVNIKDKIEEPKLQRPKRKPIPQPPADIYIKINKGGKWGFTDRNGKIVVEPIYDEVYSYKDDLCCVEKNELFGFINRDGEEVVPIIYELALSFSEGLACVYKGGLCGYINDKNDMVVDFKFDAGTSFEEGSCRVKRDGKWGELKLEDVTHVRWIN